MGAKVNLDNIGNEEKYKSRNFADFIDETEMWNVAPSQKERVGFV